MAHLSCSGDAVVEAARMTGLGSSRAQPASAATTSAIETDSRRTDCGITVPKNIRRGATAIGIHVTSAPRRRGGHVVLRRGHGPGQFGITNVWKWRSKPSLAKDCQCAPLSKVENIVPAV